MKVPRRVVSTTRVVNAFLLLAGLLLLAFFSPSESAAPAQVGIYGVVALSAVTIPFARSLTTSGPDRRSYVLATLVLLAAAVYGATTIAGVSFRAQVVESSGAAVVALVLCVGVLAATWWLTAARSSFSHVLDVLLFGSATLFMLWGAIFGEVVRNFNGSVHLASLAMALPAVDIAMFTMFFIAASRRTGRVASRLARWWAAGLFSRMVGDVLWTLKATPSDPSNATLFFWLLSISCCAQAFGNGLPLRATEKPRSSFWLLVLPYSPVLGAAGVAAYVLLTPAVVAPSLAVIGTALAFSVLLRQLLATVENVRSAGQLDITARQLQVRELELEHLSLHDALTSLPNRRYLSQRVIERQNQGDCRFVVMLIDLDDFKPVNDTMGHDVGDALLVHVARCLSAMVRGGDTVARLGGDEFAILLEGATEESATSVASRIRAAVEATVRIGEHDVRVGLSIGMSTGFGLRSFDTVLRQADIAMYERKRASDKGGLAIFRGE